MGVNVAVDVWVARAVGDAVCRARTVPTRSVNRAEMMATVGVDVGMVGDAMIVG